MILTSARLVEQAASDPAAFAELYEACFPAVFHYIQFRCDGTADRQVDDTAATASMFGDGRFYSGALGAAGTDGMLSW